MYPKQNGTLSTLLIEILSWGHHGSGDADAGGYVGTDYRTSCYKSGQVPHTMVGDNDKTLWLVNNNRLVSTPAYADSSDHSI